jgi:hypothetical protein
MGMISAAASPRARPLEHVRDHESPLAHTPALPSCQAATPPPPVRCERSMPASSIPQTWYACVITLPHLGIIESQYTSSPSCSTLRVLEAGFTCVSRNPDRIAAEVVGRRLLCHPHQRRNALAADEGSVRLNATRSSFRHFGARGPRISMS